MWQHLLHAYFWDKCFWKWLVCHHCWVVWRELGSDYRLQVCNPSAFSGKFRLSRPAGDLNQQFVVHQAASSLFHHVEHSVTAAFVKLVVLVLLTLSPGSILLGSLVFSSKVNKLKDEVQVKNDSSVGSVFSFWMVCWMDVRYGPTETRTSCVRRGASDRPWFLLLRSVFWLVLMIIWLLLKKLLNNYQWRN